MHTLKTSVIEDTNTTPGVNAGADEGGGVELLFAGVLPGAPDGDNAEEDGGGVIVVDGAVGGDGGVDAVAGDGDSDGVLAVVGDIAGVLAGVVDTGAFAGADDGEKFDVGEGTGALVMGAVAGAGDTAGVGPTGAVDTTGDGDGVDELGEADLGDGTGV
ncbi:unnamed protein product [Camellia sinensis]